MPPWQVSPPATLHAFMQLPQWLLSLIKLLQPMLPQHDCPMPHATPDGGQPHEPPAHTRPVPQTVLQSPQCFTSSMTSTQAVPQHLPPHCSGCAGQMLPAGPISPFGPLFTPAHAAARIVKAATQPYRMPPTVTRARGAVKTASARAAKRGFFWDAR
jgi:hypothetical protein